MKLQLFKRKLKEITKTTEDFDSKESLSYFNKTLLPVFALNNGGDIIYYNASFEGCFGTEIENIKAHFSKADSIQWKGSAYIKNTLFQGKEIQIYLLTIKRESSFFSTELDIVPYATLAKDGHIIEANQLFYSLLDTTKENLKQDIYSYLEENSAKALKHYLSNDAWQAESFEIKFNNEKSITAMIYFISQDNDKNFRCLLIDITEYKNLEMHLIHSQKMQAVGQLAGGIAHDFNNLLTAMLGFCDLLLIKHPAGDPSFAEIMQVKQNANRAANLVRQLLAISRKQVLKVETLDVTNIIEELIHLIRRLIGGNVNLNINHGRNLRLIKVDQGQLEQVIINLAVNARDAILAKGDRGDLSIVTSNVTITERGGVDKNLISPAANEKILPGEYVLIEAVDTGTGMDKTIIKKIFEPFFSTKALGSGTGLGLSTVYGIIKQTSGYLYVSSEPGQGTAFHIYLPVADASDIVKDPLPQVDKENLLIQKDLTGNETILIIEDEVPVRMLSSQALSNKGYNIVEADCGEKALEIIAERGGDIDLIISDVIMPGINGPTCISEIHKMYPNMKVIFMSGYAEEAFSETYGIESNINFNFLSKPFTLKQLASKVKSVLEGN